MVFKGYILLPNYCTFQVIKPTVLIGSSGVGKTFTKEVVEAMTSNNDVKPNLTLVVDEYLDIQFYLRTALPCQLAETSHFGSLQSYLTV